MVMREVENREVRKARENSQIGEPVMGEIERLNR